MYKQIKKMPNYLMKLLKKGSVKDVYHTITNVKPAHLLIALAARVDNNPTQVNFRGELGSLEINQFLDVIQHRKHKVDGDIYFWDFGNKQIYGNYIQALGAYGEYISGAFDTIYKFDWENKTVVDIGGFIGDTALYFLSRGAKKVVVYEPVAKNIQVMNMNLQGKEKFVDCHQKALAAENGPVFFTSEQPEGSCGFGHACKGNHRIECNGITISKILDDNYPIDVIKVDCEGGEEHLLDMSYGEIHSIPYWIVETHTEDLYRNIMNKFSHNGFSLVYDKMLVPTVNLMHFSRV
jgi:FkbM family methyltransferase